MKHQSHLKTVNQIPLLAVESFRAVVLDFFWVLVLVFLDQP